MQFYDGFFIFLGTEYGDGNLGTRGMALFFHSHLCNSICVGMGLTSFDLAPSEVSLLSHHTHKRNKHAGTVARGTEEICILPSQYDMCHSVLYVVFSGAFQVSVGCVDKDYDDCSP